MVVSRTIDLLLQSIGRREEYEFYLRKFLGKGDAYFALICPDGDALAESTEVLAFDLEVLLRLELKPLLVLAGPTAARQLDRLRVTGHPLRVMAPDQLQPFIAGVISVCYAPDVSLPALLPDLIPRTSRRVHLLRAGGPLRDPDGAVIPYVYTEQFAEAQRPEDVEVLQWGRELLRRFPRLHLSVASPLKLLDELFTVKGAGTVMRRGSVIQRLDDTATFDREALGTLMAASFGRSLAPGFDWGAVQTVYLEANYRGAALLERPPMGGYLSKFAVGTEARGQGLAQELWSRITADEAVLFWRSRSDNPIRSWYDQQADGRHRSGDWTVYWRGVDEARISEVIAFCRARPSDFSEVTDGGA